MTKSLSLGIKLLACALVVLGSRAQAADAAKPDANGAWTWSQAGRNGGEPRVSTVTLKVEGEKVTGKLAAPGRGGAAPTEVEISKGSIKADEISFEVTREFNGNSITTKYMGKISGDAIKGSIERPGQDGAAVKTDWEAKRVVAAKPAAPAAPAKP